MSNQQNLPTGFSQINGEIHCDGVALSQIAQQFHTPLYVYSQSGLDATIDDWKKAISGKPHRVFYAMKANNNLTLLKHIAAAGLGFDIVSAGELGRALAAGAKGEDIVYSGVGKSVNDIKLALQADIACFNVESLPELDRINEVALAMGTQARISLRINPDVDPKTHPYISTGLKANKFGIAYQDAIAAYEKAKNLPGLIISGVDCHIGSQITELSPFVDAATKVFDLVEALRNKGIDLDHIDLGGGLGVRYDNETPPSAQTLVATIDKLMTERGLTNIPLFFEPGRAMVAMCGALLTHVEYLKQGETKNFCIVDAAMNDMMRPTLYGARMQMHNIIENTEVPKLWDVVGPVCESGDFLLQNAELSVAPGDLLWMPAAGAYGMSMSSNYNARSRCVEVLVHQGQAKLIRRRETLQDLMQCEINLDTSH